MANFTITIESEFYDLWRYNIIVMASVMRGGEQCEVLKHRSLCGPSRFPWAGTYEEILLKYDRTLPPPPHLYPHLA